MRESLLKGEKEQVRVQHNSVTEHTQRKNRENTLRVNCARPREANGPEELGCRAFNTGLSA